MPIDCADGCGRTWWSIAAMMLCDCAERDSNGRAKRRKGDDWIP